MEQFQLLDEHVSNLILRFGFLDVEDLPFATAEEVENAAALALQMAAPEELIEIAVRRSVHRHPHPNPPRAAAAAVPARPVPRRPPQPPEPEPEDPNPGAYIDWQERNRILADSPVEPDDGAEEGGEDCIICSGGRVSAAINGVSSAEGTGGAGAHGAVHSMEDVNVVSLCVNACFDTSKAGGRWITTHAFDSREDSLRLSRRQQNLETCLSFNGKSSRSNRRCPQHYRPALCHDQCLKHPGNADGLRAVLPFVPVVEDDFEGHPANFDPDFGGALPLIDVGDGPEPDHIDPEPIMANANGQQRYYIMMFYADGNNTEVGDPNWRRDSAENMRRIREGDETEGRVWPQYAIEREEGRCNHQTHAQWEFQPQEEPPCFYCRITDGRQLWHCRSCGVTACDWHRFLRFGLTWQQANRTVNNLRNRVTVDSDFRYPRANANRIEAWDLFLEGGRQGSEGSKGSEAQER
ncbi:IBR domain-containing protein [Colletotrichum asianum]|uniref:IBR domain-containing protein n=1 Tax=Colletotrichum asianum TaxID=702518 RepID=A0A8H3WHZ3_9PEZI|nr:IBR domain-containing protein [Colletotrichum asianum]